MVYRNDGGGVFTDNRCPPGDGRVGLGRLGDYDGDDDLDILLTGLDNSTPTVTAVPGGCDQGRRREQLDGGRREARGSGAAAVESKK
jgi:hypothetical protein